MQEVPVTATKRAAVLRRIAFIDDRDFPAWTRALSDYSEKFTPCKIASAIRSA